MIDVDEMKLFKGTRQVSTQCFDEKLYYWIGTQEMIQNTIIHNAIAMHTTASNIHGC